MSNFVFLRIYWPDFAKTLEFAEKYVYSDPASSKNKSGLFVELMIREIMRIENIPEPEYDNTHFTRTKILKSEGFIPYDVSQWINQVRIKRNYSTHENIASEQEALSVLGFAYQIAIWFMQTYGDSNFKPEEFVKPEPPKTKINLMPLVKNQERKIEEQKSELEIAAVTIAEKEAAIAERDKKLADLEAEIEKARKERAAVQNLTPQSSLTKQDRLKISALAISKAKLTEAQTRAIIDQQLRKVGWEVDTENLRYSKGTRPQKGKKLAIAEWPVKATKTADDRADYAWDR